MNWIWAVGLFVAALSAVPGCKRAEPVAAAKAGHVHHAPHGGTLIEIGEHAYNLELVPDPAAGKLTAYVLDGHAEEFVRIPAPAIELVAMVGTQRRPLSLHAVANSATGETIGSTSQFEGEAGWLKATPEFPATIPTLEIRGTKFENVAVYLRKSP